MSIPRVIATEAATKLIQQLKLEHGELIFYQSGGCCDGSAPMCFSAKEFLLGDLDVLLGKIAEVPFYMSKQQFAYWQHTQLIIDVISGNGGMFSLERPTGLRFITRSRIFTDSELVELNKVSNN